MGLSKEQKKALKEAKKLEKLRAEEELRKKLKLEELRRELVLQNKNKSRLEQNWRTMMLKIKIPALKQDVEVMWHVFLRALDKKDHFLNYTIHLMKIADGQVSRTISSFCETVDTMINKFLKDLDELSRENNLQTKALLKQGENDAMKIRRDQINAETHLQLLIYNSHNTADANAWTTRGEDMVKQDELQFKKANVREDLRVDLENYYNTVWEEYKMVLRAYVVGTIDNVKKVRILRAKEHTMSEIIESQRKRIANNDNVLKYLRNELQQYVSGVKQLAFRERRDRHRDACKKLKNRLVRGCAKDARQLSDLVRISDEKIAYLSAAHQKGEKILRITAQCRRLETQREKVLFFGCHSIQTHAEFNTDSKPKNGDSLITNALSATTGLNKLWQRIANAELSKKALLKEKTVLEAQTWYLSKYQIDDSFMERNMNVTNCICSNELDKVTKPKISKPVAIDGSQALKYYNLK